MICLDVISPFVLTERERELTNYMQHSPLKTLIVCQMVKKLPAVSKLKVHKTDICFKNHSQTSKGRCSRISGVHRP